ncbi:MAG: alpha/beta hydrolase [Limisphaerales bacterium]
MIRLLCVVVLALGGSCFAAPKATKAPKDGDFVIGPNYADAPEVMGRAGVPKGTVHEFVMDSRESKIYPGLNGPYQRKVWVYVPAQYRKGTAAPVLVVQDGQHYLKRVTNILDNLIAERRLPAMVAVFINAGGGDGKGSERGLEYDALSDRYANYIEREVLPRITRDYGVEFTKNPDGRATMGGSSGGACALTMGWYRTDLWHRIITFSGTFVAQQSPEDAKTPHGAWEYHEHLIPQSSRKPLRIWLEVGDHDIGFDRDEATYHNWVMANNRMAAVLKAKKYHYHYDFAKEAKHVDGKVLGQTLPGALLWAWEGYGGK